MPDSNDRPDFLNMSIEQRRMIWTEALQELGGILEVLRATGWNPFGPDAPAISSSRVGDSDSYNDGHFYDLESGLSTLGGYYYEVLEDGRREKMLGGEYRVFSNGKRRGDDDKPLVRHFIDIRREESTIKYVVFGPEVATIVASDEAYRYDISGVVETLRSDGRTVAVGVEKKIDGTEYIFIDLMHINFDTEDVLKSSYRISMEDYQRGKYNVNGIFGMEGTQEFIQGLSIVVPELFSSELPSRYPSTRVVGEGSGFRVVEETRRLNPGDVIFEAEDFPEHTDRNLESAEVIDDELLTYIRYSLACKRYEDVASQLVYLANNRLVDNETGFTEEELYEKIRTGWVVVYEREEEITLLPFKLHEQDKVVLRNSGNGIETNDDIVANISRGRIWVQRSEYEDLRMETPEEIDPEEVYDLLKRAYINVSGVMDRIMMSVWPFPGMDSEMTFDKIAECVRFGLKSGTLKAQLVEGVCGPEYKLITTGWESEEDVEVLTRHFNRLELMSNIARPQDFNGSLRAMLEAGEISDLTEIPYSGIEFYVAMGELEYSFLNESVRYMRYPSDPETEEVRIGMGLSRPEEVMHNYARGRLEYTKVGYLEKGYIDKREDINSEIDPSRLEVLLEKGYINVAKIEDRFLNDEELFKYRSPIELRAVIAKIILEGLSSGEYTSELIDGNYGLEYVITRKVQDESATGSVPPPLFPTLGGSTTLNPEIDGLREHGRLRVRDGEDEITDLQVIKFDKVEETFGISVEALKERIANVVDRPTRHGLIRAGMWSNLELNKLNPIAGKEIELTTHPQGELRLNTAIIYSVQKDKEGIVGVLTDVDTTNPDYIKTMVVDFRRVESNGQTRLIVTCLQNDVAKGNIVLPTVEDGGYVFELVFEGSDVKFDPRVVWDALQGLDLKDNTPRSGYKLNRYKLEK